MIELLLHLLQVGGIVGLFCGVLASIVRHSLGFGICVFAGAVLGAVGGIFGLIFLLMLLMKLKNPTGQISVGSDSPPAAAEAVGEVLFLVFLIPVAFAGAVMGGVVYEWWRNRHAQ